MNLRHIHNLPLRIQRKALGARESRIIQDAPPVLESFLHEAPMLHFNMFQGGVFHLSGITGPDGS
ncbi:hypothetical protein IGI04_005921 [Brassica rapa subsp. trilocularis]|uniref:Uncharacterized protein n=1 Tax=Brassica rapa subsp. trilocularis TaxID=1813537 RepID=A0ABQ7NFD6_BRACM|nr:hypothetical protein IGI04_005921 [Brassica rapa subsp. trilocularis]